MMDTLLTEIEGAGHTVIVPRSYDRHALALHLIALKKAGHAILADETTECGELTGELRVFHMLNCVACRRLHARKI
jgi:hypothetical protein